MTPRTQQLLKFITAQIETTGLSPRYVDMQAHMGLASKSGVHRMVQKLIAEGHLRRAAGGTRAIQLVRPSLKRVSTEALIAELRARGIVVDHAR